MTMSVAQRIEEHIMSLGLPHPEQPEQLDTALSEREYQVLIAISRGLENSEIAAELDLSVHTVKTHVKRLFLKLDASCRANAVAIAFRRGLLK